MSQLRLRLKNCLQTILELEAGIKENRPEIFDSDFLILKNYLVRLEDLQFNEDDVNSLEILTARFLKEIGKNSIWEKTCKILQ